MRLPLASALLALVLAVAPVDAQPRPSQQGGVTQNVNETTITLQYDRPVARGRKLFGGIIDFGAIWTPGANRATWIEFTQPVTVEGRSVAAGRYGIWILPQEDAPWDVVLVRDWDTHHSYFSFETEVLRVPVTPQSGAHMETLAFYFPAVGPYDATLNFHWGTTVVPLRIEVGR